MGHPISQLYLWTWLRKVQWTSIELGEQENASHHTSTQRAHLVFLGPPPSPGQKVILYMPGGAYLNPIQGPQLTLWHWVQSQLNQEHYARVAILLYRLRPCSPFPSPVVDAVLALHHLLDVRHTKPEHIVLAGDSAGGHLVLQLLAVLAGKIHVPSVSRLPKLHGKFAGAVLISPWVCLSGSESWDDRYDCISKKTYSLWGLGYLADLKSFFYSSTPRHHFVLTNADSFPNELDLNAFSDPYLAQPGYFSFVSALTRRVLVTSGEKECMALAGVHTQLVERLKEDNILPSEHHGVDKLEWSWTQIEDKVLGEDHTRPLQVDMFVQHDGVHADPMLDFLFFWQDSRGKGRNEKSIRMDVLQWINNSFQ